MTMFYTVAAFVVGSIVALVALILVEIAARWYSNIEGHLVGPYDAERDSAEDYVRRTQG